MCKWTVVLRVRGSGNDSCRGIADSGIESDSGFAIAIVVVVCRMVVIQEAVVAPRSWDLGVRSTSDGM